MDIKEVLSRRDVNIIDVREEYEYEMGHIPQAINIPLSRFMSSVPKIKKLGTPVVFYCRSGNRSGQAVQLLEQMGMKNVYNGGSLSTIEAHLNVNHS